MKFDRGWAYPDADEFMVGEMHDDGTYQASHLRLALEHVSDWTCAIDGGAHVGTWSKLLMVRFGNVIAVEPSPDTFEALTWNLRQQATALLTDFATKVTLINSALGAVVGTVSIAPLEPRAAALKNTGARFVQDGGTIPRITIDSLNLPSLGFLKLDVEGSEPLALMGARATLGRCRPIVLFENKGLCRRFGFKPDGTQGVLRAAGYKFLQRAGCDEIWRPA